MAEKALTREQIKNLNDRIEWARCRWSYDEKPKKYRVPRPTAEVTRARAVIRAFERKKEKLSRRYSNRITKARATAINAVLYNTAKLAIAAVEKFESGKFL